jgi:hypothetical protein
MQKHHRLIVGIVALSTGVLLAGISIFESPAVFTALAFPRSAAKDMAFLGMGAIGLGAWQLFPLLMNWSSARTDLVTWAESERGQSLLIGLSCMAIGSILLLSMVWATIDTASLVIPTKVKSIVLAIITGGLIVGLGGTLVKIAIGDKPR